jgi:hypothetical protein
MRNIPIVQNIYETMKIIVYNLEGIGACRSFPRDRGGMF